VRDPADRGLSTTRVGEDIWVKGNRSVWSQASGCTQESGAAAVVRAVKLERSQLRAAEVTIDKAEDEI
jgi:hypothetical protein